MKRPHLAAGIDQLERVFAASECNAKQLRVLARELEFRNTMRADNLALKVRNALKRLSSEESLAVGVPTTETAHADPPAVTDRVMLDRIGALVTPVEPYAQIDESAPTFLAHAETSAAGVTTDETLKVVLKKATKAPEDITTAYSILDLAVGASWEQIEASRRAIVARASPLALRSLPSEQSQVFRLAAQHANQAAALLRYW